jgi:hypothetical protein
MIVHHVAPLKDPSRPSTGHSDVFGHGLQVRSLLRRSPFALNGAYAHHDLICKIFSRTRAPPPTTMPPEDQSPSAQHFLQNRISDSPCVLVTCQFGWSSSMVGSRLGLRTRTLEANNVSPPFLPPGALVGALSTPPPPLEPPATPMPTSPSFPPRPPPPPLPL